MISSINDQATRPNQGLNDGDQLGDGGKDPVGKKAKIT